MLPNQNAEMPQNRRQRTKCEASETFCGRRAMGMMRRGGVSGGIFKGGRRGGDTQYVLPRPPLNRLWGFGESLAAQRPPSTSYKRNRKTPFFKQNKGYALLLGSIK